MSEVRSWLFLAIPIYRFEIWASVGARLEQASLSGKSNDKCGYIGSGGATRCEWEAGSRVPRNRATILLSNTISTDAMCNAN